MPKALHNDTTEAYDATDDHDDGRGLMSTVFLQQVRDDATYYFENDIDVFACANCGLSFGVPSDYIARRRKDGQTFYCPSGHGNVYRETEEDRLRKQLEKARREAQLARDNERFHREQAAIERRSAAAYKGHLTRARNRIANGVCPVPGCKRSGFVQVMRHIATEHPEWLHEHPEVDR